MLISLFVPPAFCLCFVFTGIYFRGISHHVCDVAYEENICGPIRTRKCKSTNWLTKRNIRSNALIQNPYTFHFSSNKSWFIVSKAFERSINKVQIFSPLSEALFHFSSMVIKECCVPMILEIQLCFDSLSCM